MLCIGYVSHTHSESGGQYSALGMFMTHKIGLNSSFGYAVSHSFTLRGTQHVLEMDMTKKVSEKYAPTRITMPQLRILSYSVCKQWNVTSQ